MTQQEPKKQEIRKLPANITRLKLSKTDRELFFRLFDSIYDKNNKVRLVYVPRKDNHSFENRDSVHILINDELITNPKLFMNNLSKYEMSHLFLYRDVGEEWWKGDLWHSLFYYIADLLSLYNDRFLAIIQLLLSESGRSYSYMYHHRYIKPYKNKEQYVYIVNRIEETIDNYRSTGDYKYLDELETINKFVELECLD